MIKIRVFNILSLVLLVAMVACRGAAPTAVARMDGTWISNVDGRMRILVLQERADGRLLGYIPTSPATFISGGFRADSSVNINLSGADPLHSWNATISGTLHDNSLVATYTESSETSTLTFERAPGTFSVEHWVFFANGTDDKVRAMRILAPDGTFIAGGFVGVGNCNLLTCGGDIANWTISGATHTITMVSSGTCASSSTLTGTWDSSSLFLTGSYTTRYCDGSKDGTFTGVKEGLTTIADIRGILQMQADFTDRIEHESATAADAFASSYLYNEKTKSAWESQLATLYANYNTLEARIAGVMQIITYNDAEVFPYLRSAPRMTWRFIINGEPAAGGAREAVMNIATDPLSTDPLFSEELYWLGNEGSRSVFTGNGYTQPFSITMPILPGDAAHTAYGLWPFGAHGGGHPEGHPGWDVVYKAGAKAVAAADGTVVDIKPNTYHPGEWSISVQLRPGHFTRYDDLAAVEPGITVGTHVHTGDPLGAPSEYPIGALSYFMIHFALNIHAQTVCPAGYLNAEGQTLFDDIWQTAAYGEMLTEPLPCNPTTVSFPLARTWLRSSGPLAPKIEFTRLDPSTQAYTYRLLDADGTIVETGTVSQFDPGALPYATIDLLPAGGAAMHLGVIHIVGETMRVNWNASRPVDLSGASVYTFAH